jgi:hypothetical protein
MEWVPEGPNSFLNGGGEAQQKPILQAKCDFENCGQMTVDAAQIY